MTAILLVALGGAIGAPLRYHLDRMVQRRHKSGFPWGTLAVNVLGSFVLGVAIETTNGLTLDLLGTGLCGALTTYSTFGYETVRLFENGVCGKAAANVALSIVAGLGAALLGIALA